MQLEYIQKIKGAEISSKAGTGGSGVQASSHKF